MLSSEQQGQVSQISEGLLESMVADLARTIAIVGHREVKAGRAPCHRCGMCCRGNQQAPPPGALLSSQSASSTMHAGNHSYPGASRSRASTPQLTTDTPTSSSGTVGKNGVVYVPCLDCGRQIASNRYAPHLAGCLGLSGGQRRTARSTATSNGKLRLGGSERSTSSLYVDNESDAGSDFSGPAYSVAGSSTSGREKASGRGASARSKASGSKRAASPGVAKVGKTKKSKTGTSHPHPLTQSATFVESPKTPTLPPRSDYQDSQTSQRLAGDGDEDAEGEDDDGSGIGFQDADGEHDEDYMNSGSSNDGSDGMDLVAAQEFDDEYA